jgi:hypothetical protein
VRKFAHRLSPFFACAQLAREKCVARLHKAFSTRVCKFAHPFLLPGGQLTMIFYRPKVCKFAHPLGRIQRAALLCAAFSVVRRSDGISYVPHLIVYGSARVCTFAHPLPSGAGGGAFFYQSVHECATSFFLGDRKINGKKR